jgi:hypothetical protein
MQRTVHCDLAAGIVLVVLVAVVTAPAPEILTASDDLEEAREPEIGCEFGCMGVDCPFAYTELALGCPDCGCPFPK